MGAVGSIAEGRPLMAGSTLRSLFEGDCSGFETGSRTLEWLYTVCGTAFRAVSDYCRMRARRHARNSKGYGVLPLPPLRSIVLEHRQASLYCRCIVHQGCNILSMIGNFLPLVWIGAVGTSDIPLLSNQLCYCPASTHTRVACDVEWGKLPDGRRNTNKDSE